MMTKEIQDFIHYMREAKKVSDNTAICYERDLRKMERYFLEQGIEQVGQVTATGLNSYILYQEKQGRLQNFSWGAILCLREHFLYP